MQSNSNSDHTQTPHAGIRFSSPFSIFFVAEKVVVSKVRSNLGKYTADTHPIQKSFGISSHLAPPLTSPNQYQYIY